jgi:hypothetical protein
VDAGADPLVDALADVVVKCAAYGEQDGGYVFLYLLPTGPIHRAIVLLGERGVIVRPGMSRPFYVPEQRMSQPSVGRMVHYVSRGSADGVFPPACRAATVTEVGEDGNVGLCVQNPTGLFFHPLADRGGVEHAGGGTGPDLGCGGAQAGTWHWPDRV